MIEKESTAQEIVCPVTGRKVPQSGGRGRRKLYDSPEARIYWHAWQSMMDCLAIIKPRMTKESRSQWAGELFRIANWLRGRD